MGIRTTVARLFDGLRSRLRSLLGGVADAATAVVAALFVGTALLVGAAATLTFGVALAFVALTAALLRLAPTGRRVRRHPDGTIPV